MTTRKRGRPSGAELAVRRQVLEQLERPDAPYDLTDEESEEWWAVVNRLPAEWFPRETHALLAAYCRHVVSIRRVSELIRKIEGSAEFDLDTYDKALKVRERESRAASSLATRMRITQQTTYDKSRKKPISAAPPWQQA